MHNRDRESENDLLAFIVGRYFGKYRGIVKDPDDPERRGRIQVQVKGVLGEHLVWALPCVAYAGPGVGTFFLPDKETMVWIEFEGGNVNYPIWTGCFWRPEEIAAADHKPSIKFIKTKRATIRIDDDEGTVEISNSAGATILLDLNTIKSKAPASISTQVATQTTDLTSTEFNVNKGVFQVK